MAGKTLSIILAGGAGKRLSPLTTDRAKPAVPFAGSYRIIDFALSNCYHSGLRQVLVLTQYKSHSLQKHLRDGWSIFSPGIGEYITAVPAQMRTGANWYAGTADAVFQNLYLLERSGAEQVVILAGDHIYRMDYARMLQEHQGHGADLTIACMKVALSEASEFGVVDCNDQGRIERFYEKPENPWPIRGDANHALASMGIYVFTLRGLVEQLIRDQAEKNSSHDFGKDIIPKLLESHDVRCYRFGQAAGRVSADGYWRDVGTLDAYYQANMDLLRLKPPLDLYQRDWQIRTAEIQAPPARAVQGASGRRSEVENAILGAGTVIAGGAVWGCVLGRNVTVEEGAVAKHAVLFDDVTVARGARIKNCIVDKNVHIPAGETIGFDLELDRKRFTVSTAGISVVPRGYRFATGYAGGADETQSARYEETTRFDSPAPSEQDINRNLPCLPPRIRTTNLPPSS